MENHSLFGERLQELLFYKGVSLENFAESLQMSLSLIYKYFRKEYYPSAVNAIKIADYFHCSLDFLFGLDNDYEEKSYLPPKPFREVFQMILKDKQCSRYRLHKNTHLAQQSIDDWFHGVRTPNVENLIILAKYFDCSLDYLTGREP